MSAAHSEHTIEDSAGNKPTHSRKDPSTGQDVRGRGRKKQNMTRKAQGLSPGKLAKLKSGPRVHIFIGPADDQYVGVESAYVNLLAHYSGYAKTKLVSERIPGLSIIDGTKRPVVWIYKYMLAGEHDPVGMEKFEELAIAGLVLVYSHCVVLEYQSLMDSILARLHEKLYHSLPDVPTIKNIAIFAPSVNQLVAKAVARSLLQPLTFDYGPYMQHAANDEDFSTAVGTAVHDLLERRITTGETYYSQKSLNRFVKWSNEYYQRRAERASRLPQKDQVEVIRGAELVPTTTTARAESMKHKNIRKARKSKKMGAHAGELLKADDAPEVKTASSEPTLKIVIESKQNPAASSKGDTATNLKGKRMNKPRCYVCKERGHTKRDCLKHTNDIVTSYTTTATATTTTTPATITGELTDHRPVEAEKKVARRAHRPPPVCFACNEEGHIARKCPAPPAAYIHERAASPNSATGILSDITNQRRSNYARNKNQRRAKAERIYYAPIVDKGNVEW